MFDKLKQDANVKKWTIAAKFGDVHAMYELGEYYFKQSSILDGSGVVSAHYDCLNWYKKAADKGHAISQYNVGEIYYYGSRIYNPIKRNLTEAVKYYRMASENGFDFAQQMLGVCYYYGFGVEQDYKEAVRWFLESIENAEKNESSKALCHFNTSYNRLGECYLNGYGVAKDVNTAIAYYRKVLSTNASEYVGDLDDLPFYDGRKFNLTNASRNRLRSLGYNV